MKLKGPIEKKQLLVKILGWKILKNLKIEYVKHQKPLIKAKGQL